MFCLPKELVNKILKAIRSGEFNPEKLNNMTSAEVRSYLTGLVGSENAKQINLLYERKLLLKNQEKAMYDLAREITGLSQKDKQATLDKIKETYIKKQERMYSPKEYEKFLNELTSDIYSKKYRTQISLEEAQKITELSQLAKEKLDKVQSIRENGTYKNPEDRKTIGINFGASKTALDNYISAIKQEARKRPLISLFRGTIKERVGAIIEDARISFNFIAENSRAFLAGFMDNSFFGRQARKMATRPLTMRAWASNFKQSMKDGFRVLFGEKNAREKILDAIKADVYSRESYLKGYYDKKGLETKLDIGTGEEEYPTSFPSKIPIIGRLFSMAETMYEGGAMRCRADAADIMYKLAENQQQAKTGKTKLEKEDLASINLLVNSMTGRGSIGGLERAGKEINKVFFAPKWVKSQIDTLTHPLGFDISGKKITSFARRQAQKNVLSLVVSSGLILLMAKMIDPDSVEEDPTSADFGKIKIGNTRIDVTGGLASYVVLAMRIFNQASKSSTTGVKYKFNDGYGSQDGFDVFWNFVEGKFSPIGGVLADLIKQKTFEGKKPTIGTEIEGLAVPIIVQTGIDAYKKSVYGSEILLSLLADFVGFSAGTYGYTANWEEKTSKEMINFKKQVGKDKFKQANEDFIKRVDKYIQSEAYKSIKDNEKKSDELSDKKTEIKKDIFDRHGFNPEDYESK